MNVAWGGHDDAGCCGPSQGFGDAIAHDSTHDGGGVGRDAVGEAPRLSRGRRVKQAVLAVDERSCVIRGLRCLWVIEDGSMLRMSPFSAGTSNVKPSVYISQKRMSQLGLHDLGALMYKHTLMYKSTPSCSANTNDSDKCALPHRISTSGPSATTCSSRSSSGL